MIPQESLANQVLSPFSYVLVVATSTFFLNTVHSTLTGRARKSAGIAYPASYASNEQAAKDPKAYKFNCGTHCTPHLLSGRSESMFEDTCT